MSPGTLAHFKRVAPSRVLTQARFVAKTAVDSQARRFVFELEAQEIDGALDRFFDWADDAFAEGRFADVDSVLGCFPGSRPSLDLLVGVLAATLPAREHLRERAALADRVRAAAIRTGRGDVDALLAGLE